MLQQIDHPSISDRELSVLKQDVKQTKQSLQHVTEQGNALIARAKELVKTYSNTAQIKR